MKDRIRDVLVMGKQAGVYPGAVLLVALKGEIIFLEEVGNRSMFPEPVPMRRDTIFDLASLTKVLATAAAMMVLVDGNRIGLDQPLAEILDSRILKEKGALTPRLMLSHCAGFAAWKPFFEDLSGAGPGERKSALRKMIIDEPLVYEPGAGCLYSDLGFMMLEWVVEEVTGMPMPLFLERVFYRPLLLERTSLGAPPFAKDLFAATEDCPWRKRIIQGEVHDDNAFAAGGYSGHAGLFGTAGEVYRIVNLLREHYRGVRGDFLRPSTVREFFCRQAGVKGCTFALGWDTPSDRDSSAGRFFSSRSVGHLGFTGTSVWMDLEKDVMVVLLTNRIHPTRRNEGIKAFRPKIHDLIMDELGLAG